MSESVKSSIAEHDVAVGHDRRDRVSSHEEVDPEVHREEAIEEIVPVVRRTRNMNRWYRPMKRYRPMRTIGPISTARALDPRGLVDIIGPGLVESRGQKAGSVDDPYGEDVVPSRNSRPSTGKRRSRRLRWTAMDPSWARCISLLTRTPFR